jgi:predicted nucleic acid-binding Zn finger protein
MPTSVLDVVARNPGRNIFSTLKQSVNEEIIGVGCLAHILHNCFQHGADCLSVDVESIVLKKKFNFFHIYAVRTQKLKEFCDFVELKYEELLRHTKTRWLTLFPAIEKILKMYPALKEYFLSQPTRSVPTIIQKFFEDEL